MSENLDRRNSELTVSELEAQIRLDFDSPEDDRDIEQILMENGSDVTKTMEQAEVLAQAYKALNITGKTAQESLDSFYRNYPQEGLGTPASGKKARKPWFRRTLAVAAVIVLLVGIPLAARAFHWEALWNTVAKWAKETFSFVSDPDAELTEPDKQDQLQYSSLKDVLPTENGADKLVPTWIPDGYVLEDITVDETPSQKVYVAIYKNGEKYIYITVRSYLNTDSEKVEILDKDYEIYKVSDIEYYIFPNMDQMQVAWEKDSYVCSISGYLNTEEIKIMINSIGE